ncbi:MAG TPA: VanZ family protein [Gammaproteobacteria bacterium]
MTTVRVLSGALAVLWMGTIYYLSSHPMPEIDLGFSAQDKLVHLLAYGLLGALLLGAFRLRPGGYMLRQIALAALIATLYGLTDEWHQSFVPGRNSDALDVVADAVGALLGSTLLWALARRLSPGPAA